jgi:hypothetical protein
MIMSSELISSPLKMTDLPTHAMERRSSAGGWTGLGTGDRASWTVANMTDAPFVGRATRDL